MLIVVGPDLPAELRSAAAWEPPGQGPEVAQALRRVERKQVESPLQFLASRRKEVREPHHRPVLLAPLLSRSIP